MKKAEISDFQATDDVKSQLCGITDYMEPCTFKQVNVNMGEDKISLISPIVEGEIRSVSAPSFSEVESNSF